MVEHVRAPVRTRDTLPPGFKPFVQLVQLQVHAVHET